MSLLLLAACSGDDTSGGAGGGDDGNLAPTIELLTPADGAVLDGSVAITFTAQVADDRDAPGDLTLLWTSNRRAQPLSELPANSLGGSTIEVADLEAGEHVITVGATDSGGKVGTDTVIVTVNAAPGAPEVTISPAAPNSADDLQAVIVTDATDPNRAASELSYRYRWFKDGEFANETGATVVAARTSRDEVWEVRVVAADGLVDGAEATAQVTIANSPPSCEAASLLPSAGTTETALSCSCSGWEDADGDAADDRCAFYDGPTLLDDSGACSLDASKTAKGMDVECVYTPSDGTEDGEPRRSSAVPLLNAPPTAPEAALTPEVADATTELSCGLTTPSTDADGDTLSYVARWLVNEHPVAGADASTLIAGALTDELGATARRGDAIACELRAHDGEDDSAPGRSDAVTLGNAPPVLGNVVIGTMSGEPAAEGEILRCVVGDEADPDGDAVTRTYYWYVNGELVAGVSGENLTDAHFEKGDEISCAVVGDDGFDATAPEASKATLTIDNSAPSLTGATLSPAAPNPYELVTCSPVGWMDPDGDPPEFVFAWFELGVDGALTPIAGASGGTMTPNMLEAGDRLVCRITPGDGDAEGAPVQSPPATIVEPQPTAPVVAIEAPDGAGGVVTCALVEPAEHFDGAVAYTYYWTVADGAEAAGQATRDDLADCQHVSCRAEASDGVTTLSSGPAATQIPVGPSCTSAVACQVPVCAPAGGCALEDAEDGATCDDGDACSAGDTCQAGQCVPDGIAAAGTPCEDGLFCTSGDQCDASGACIGGANPCDYGVGSCLVGTCDEAGDSCSDAPKAPGTACSDGDGCTQGDSCDDSGACAPGGAPDCSWQDGTCVAGVCSSTGDATYECLAEQVEVGTPCASDDVCASATTCDVQGTCGGGVARDCQAEVGTDCLIATCDADQGGCVTSPVADGSSCNDGEFCTLTDTCQAGVCAGEGDACAEERISVSGGAAPSLAALGAGRYATAWWSSDTRLRASDDQGGRMNEEGHHAARVWGGSAWVSLAARSGQELFVAEWDLNPRVACKRPSQYHGNCSDSETGWLRGSWYDTDGELVATENLAQISVGVVGSSYQTITSAWVSTVRLVPLALDQGYGLLQAIDGGSSGPGGGSYPFALRAVIYQPPANGGGLDARLTLVATGSIYDELSWDGATSDDGTGTFALAWIDGNRRDIYMRRYLASGQPAAGSTNPWLARTVDSDTAITAVRVVGLSDSKLVVAWEEEDDGGGRDVYVQRFTAMGDPIGDPTLVPPDNGGAQTLGDVDRFFDNAFVVTYSESGTATEGQDVYARLFKGSGVHDGEPIPVNGRTSGDQYDATVEVLDGDEWVVAFAGAGHVWTRRFQRDGSAAMGRVAWPLNETKEGAQRQIRAAREAGGNVLAVYESPVEGGADGEILARLIDPDGPERLYEQQLNTTTTFAQLAPTVAGSAAGFVVAWESAEQDGSAEGIIARWLDADGTPLTDEVGVNTTTASFQRNAAVTMSDDGTTVFAWGGANPGAGTYAEVYGRVMASDGGAVSDEFQVNVETAALQGKPSVAHSADGKVIFAWESRNQDGEGNGIFVRRFDLLGNAMTGEVQVNTTTALDQQHPTVALSADGARFTVCWESYGQDATTSLGVYCKAFDAVGLAPLGDEQRVHAITAGEQAHPAVAYDSTGQPVVAWDTEQVDFDRRAIHVRSLTAEGAPYGPRFVLNRVWSGDQSAPDVVALPGGEILVAWQSTDEDGSDESVHFRLLGLP